MVKFGPVDAICQSNFVQVRSVSKIKKPVYVNEMGPIYSQQLLYISLLMFPLHGE